MKAFKLISTVLLFCLTVLACSKNKKEPEPEPAPTPQPSISVKINGIPFSCSSCASSYKSGGIYGLNFHIPNSQDRFLFSFLNFPGTGTYSFVKNGDPAFIYQKNNVYFKAVNGSLNITAIDTSANGAISKFVCTFSCETDTTADVFYSFKEGATNF